MRRQAVQFSQTCHPIFRHGIEDTVSGGVGGTSISVKRSFSFHSAPVSQPASQPALFAARRWRHRNSRSSGRVAPIFANNRLAARQGQTAPRHDANTCREKQGAGEILCFASRLGVLNRRNRNAGAQRSYGDYAHANAHMAKEGLGGSGVLSSTSGTCCWARWKGKSCG